MLGDDGFSVGGAGSGTGADGSGMHSNFAVKRHAGSLVAGGDKKKALIRLPKAVAMFANRACRHSIMIGTALSQEEMENIVRKMYGIEQPWNCPHGRPTMRHVSKMMPHLIEDVEYEVDEDGND